jgi:hypothetical protein
MARLLICVCLWLFLLPLNVRADVGRWEEACDKFNWNPNAELDLAGYKGYRRLTGTSQWEETIDLGNVIMVTCKDAGIDRYGRWDFTVTAYDTSGNESTYADFVSVEIIPGLRARDAGEPPPEPEDRYTEVDGHLAFDVEAFHVNTPGSQGHIWEGISENGVAYMQALPKNGANHNTNYLTDSPRLDYRITITNPGPYYVWVRGQALASDEDSLHVGVDGSAQQASDRMDGFEPYGNWVWTNHTRDESEAVVTFPDPGPYLINIWMRESGVRLDKIIFTQEENYQP